MTKLNKAQSLSLNDLRSSFLGFDQLLSSVMDQSNVACKTNYPPYNIIKTSDEKYTIELSVAGIPKDQIEITQHGVELTVKYQKPSPENEEFSVDSMMKCTEYLHRGISSRSFTTTFRLADDYYEVVNAKQDNGLLIIEIVHNVPEQKKPRLVSIQ